MDDILIIRLLWEAEQAHVRDDPFLVAARQHIRYRMRTVPDFTPPFTV